MSSVQMVLGNNVPSPLAGEGRVMWVHGRIVPSPLAGEGQGEGA